MNGCAGGPMVDEMDRMKHKDGGVGKLDVECDGR